MLLPCIFVVHGWSWVTSDHLMLLEIEMAEKLIVLWPLQELHFEAVVPAVVQFCSAR